MTRHQEVYNEDYALYVPCSRVQLARVVVRVLVLVDVIICVIVMLVLIARVDVVHAVDTVFLAIFRSHFSVVEMYSLQPLYIDMKMIIPLNCSGSHFDSVIIFESLSRIFFEVSPVHSNSICSPLIRSKSLR